MAEIGVLEYSPVLYNDWVIKKSDWLKIEESQGYRRGPKFVVKNVSFGLGFYYQTDIRVWLQKYSKVAITIESFSIHLVGINGTMQEICSKTGLSFPENQSYLNKGISDGQFARPKIFYDGEVRIRCRLEIKPNKNAGDKVVSLLGPSLITDLRKEVGTQFSDFTLVIF